MNDQYQDHTVTFLIQSSLVLILKNILYYTEYQYIKYLESL